MIQEILVKISIPNAQPQTKEHIEHLVLNQLNSPYIKVEVSDKDV